MFNRKREEDRLGSNLESLSLLMRKTFTKDTVTKDEELQLGTTFEK